jgi:hypothetical protein
VTLHALDVNRNGDVMVTFSRGQKPHARERRNAWSLPMLAAAVRATDDLGTTYSPSTRGYDPDTPKVVRGYAEPVVWEIPDVHLRLRVIPSKTHAMGAPPTTVSVTISNGAPRGQVLEAVTFRNLPLPPRQNTDDLFAAETEVIQY